MKWWIQPWEPNNPVVKDKRMTNRANKHVFKACEVYGGVKECSW